MALKTVSNGMGNWKTNTHPFKWRDGKPRGARPSQTVSKRPRIRLAKAPTGGWLGGDPLKNGFRTGK